MSYRGRFAPSPTGQLHFGSLVAALGSWLCARAAGGRWLVRIEDIDPPREVPGSAEDILATLDACGLLPDEPPWYQSRRRAAYDTAFAALRDAGHVFPCWCSRSDLETSGGVHRGECRVGPHPIRPPAWRLRVPELRIAFDDRIYGRCVQDLSDVGDFVIKRVEGWYAYQLAVVVDDAAQAIDDVVRGADLLDSTARQIHLQRLLHFPTPTYAHLPLALDAAGRKLSKQDRAHPVERRDPLPALRAALAFLGQRSDWPAHTPQELLHAALRDFDLARIKPDVMKPEATRPARAQGGHAP